MTIVQALIADRDEFAFIAGSTAAFGKPVNRSVPKDILLAFHDTFDIRLQVVVFMNRNGGFEITDIKKTGETVFPAKLGVLGRSNDILQYFPLGVQGIILPGFNAPESHTGQ